MAMDKGDSDCTTGASKLIYDCLVADSRNGFSGSMTTAQTNSVKALCYAMAQVIDHITAHGKAVITTSTGALQKVSGTDTDPPSAERELTLR